VPEGYPPYWWIFTNPSELKGTCFCSFFCQSEMTKDLALFFFPSLLRPMRQLDMVWAKVTSLDGVNAPSDIVKL